MVSYYRFVKVVFCDKWTFTESGLSYLFVSPFTGGYSHIIVSDDSGHLQKVVVYKQVTSGYSDYFL